METSASAPSQGSFNIHTIHWSTIVLGTAAVVALVALVAAAILSNTPLMVIGGAYFLVCGVGAYYTHTFSEYKTLESHNTMLRQQINQLAQTVAISRDGNERLEAQTAELEKLREEKETMRREHVEAMETERQKVHEEVQELSRINHELEKRGEKTTKEMQELSEKFDRETKRLEEALQKEKSSIDKLEQTISELRREITRLQGEVKEQSELVNRYDQENKEYDALNKQLEAKLKAFDQQQLGAAKLQKITEGANSLADETRKLNESTAVRKEQLEQMQAIVKKLVARIKKLEAALNAAKEGVK